MEMCGWVSTGHLASKLKMDVEGQWQEVPLPAQETLFQLAVLQGSSLG